jgi:hypothetical protein
MSTAINILAGVLAGFGGICYCLVWFIRRDFTIGSRILAVSMGLGCLYAAVRIFIGL